jgi:hypothetical protein
MGNSVGLVAYILFHPIVYWKHSVSCTPKSDTYNAYKDTPVLSSSCSYPSYFSARSPSAHYANSSVVSPDTVKAIEVIGISLNSTVFETEG